MTGTLLVHGTTIAIDGRAVLLRGPSGAGKSDLGLRLIDAGARLVADDQSELRRDGGTILVRAPAALLGMIELRGIGIVRLDPLSDMPLALIVDLAAAEAIERMPSPRTETLFGVDLPVIALAPFEASAPAKLRAALRAFTDPDGPAMNGA